MAKIVSMMSADVVIDFRELSKISPGKIGEVAECNSDHVTLLRFYDMYEGLHHDNPETCKARRINWCNTWRISLRKMEEAMDTVNQLRTLLSGDVKNDVSDSTYANVKNAVIESLKPTNYAKSVDKDNWDIGEAGAYPKLDWNCVVLYRNNFHFLMPYDNVLPQHAVYQKRVLIISRNNNKFEKLCILTAWK